MKALVLSGGGARGAYQAGVIRRLADQGSRWDLIAGVSVGAVNAAHLAHFGVQTQRAGALTLEAFWRRITGNRTIYTSWGLGALAMLWQGALHDTAPLRALIESAMSEVVIRRSGVKLRLGAVSLTTGRYRTITEQDDRLSEWVMASAAFPVAFRPSFIDGELWVDGGVRNVTPLKDAIKSGATEIDVVMTSPVRGDVAEWDVQKGRSAIEIGLRAAGILSDEVYINDLREASRAGVVVRVHAPEIAWMDDPLDFDPKKIAQRLDYGLHQRTPVQLTP
jgi:NTE family protein